MATVTEQQWADAIIAALEDKFSAECPLIGVYSLRDTGGTIHDQLNDQHALLLRPGDARLAQERRVLDRQAVEVDWVISVAVPTNTPDAELVLLTRARRIATLVRSGTGKRDRLERGNRWGLADAVGDADAPEIPEWDDIDLHGYVMRPVRWRQTGHFARD